MFGVFLGKNIIDLKLKLVLVQFRQTITVTQKNLSVWSMFWFPQWILIPDLITLLLREESKSWVFLADKSSLHRETKSCSAAGDLQLPLKMDGGRRVSDWAEFSCYTFTAKYQQQTWIVCGRLQKLGSVCDAARLPLCHVCIQPLFRGTCCPFTVYTFIKTHSSNSPAPKDLTDLQTFTQLFTHSHKHSHTHGGKLHCGHRWFGTGVPADLLTFSFVFGPNHLERKCIHDPSTWLIWAGFYTEGPSSYRSQIELKPGLTVQCLMAPGSGLVLVLDYHRWPLHACFVAPWTDSANTLVKHQTSSLQWYRFREHEGKELHQWLPVSPFLILPPLWTVQS